MKVRIDFCIFSQMKHYIIEGVSPFDCPCPCLMLGFSEEELLNNRMVENLKRSHRAVEKLSSVFEFFRKIKKQEKS